MHMDALHYLLAAGCWFTY